MGHMHAVCKCVWMCVCVCLLVFILVNWFFVSRRLFRTSSTTKFFFGSFWIYASHGLVHRNFVWVIRYHSRYFKASVWRNDKQSVLSLLMIQFVGDFVEKYEWEWLLGLINKQFLNELWKKPAELQSKLRAHSNLSKNACNFIKIAAIWIPQYST